VLSVTNQEALDCRRQDLELFLLYILEIKELMNSREVIKFLQLDTFCPEFLVVPPKLILD
jgi:hypothetical protein